MFLFRGKTIIIIIVSRSATFCTLLMYLIQFHRSFLQLSSVFRIVSINGQFLFLLLKNTSKSLSSHLPDFNITYISYTFDHL